MLMELPAVYRRVEGGYVAWVREVPGANTQSETLEEARANLHEAVQLVVETNRERSAVAESGEVITEPLSIPIP
jgi:predicted RNase H-like HicB family nuclease